MEEFKFKASELQSYLDGDELSQDFSDLCEKVLEIFAKEGGQNFILGKVIIENDFLDEDETHHDE